MWCAVSEHCCTETCRRAVLEHGERPHEKMAELATRDGWAILQPTGADASLELLGDWCRQRRASLHAAIFSESALLLRGWD